MLSAKITELLSLQLSTPAPFLFDNIRRFISFSDQKKSLHCPYSSLTSSISEVCWLCRYSRYQNIYWIQPLHPPSWIPSQSKLPHLSARPVQQLPNWSLCCGSGPPIIYAKPSKQPEPSFLKHKLYTFCLHKTFLWIPKIFVNKVQNLEN